MPEGPTVDQAEAIIETATDALGNWDNDYEVREDYSGRGMFGNTCVAITGDGSDSGIFVAIGYLIASGELPDDASQWFHRSDSMGRGWVIY